MFDFNEMIHEERSKLLRLLPKGAETFCSAGCAGTWYFNWIEENYGKVDLHYGVELYSPEPSDLPANVKWIVNSSSDMNAVPTASTDILFSGQNIEHLYYKDIAGFFTESNRVLKHDGIICIDSPNRSVTQSLGYVQPQHTLELSVEDAVGMLEAAGFEILNVYGIWRCHDGNAFFPNVGDEAGDVELRISSAKDSPSDSFIWWVVAQKKQSPRAELTAVIDQIVVKSFPAFVASRFRKLGGSVIAMEGTEAIISVAQRDDGYVFYGPYIPLTEGVYTAEFSAKFHSEEGSLTIDVTSSNGTEVIAQATVQPSKKGQWVRITLPFSLGNYTEGVETRLYASGVAADIKFGSQIMRV
jgi:Methyltransferase domain